MEIPILSLSFGRVGQGKVLTPASAAKATSARFINLYILWECHAEKGQGPMTYGIFFDARVLL